MSILGGLDDKGSELIANYRAVSAKLRKRFMKKPNVKEASEEYGMIANKLKNNENNEYAALCFTAMAKCDQLTGDSGSEAESWANAGRQFLLAEEKLLAAGNVSYHEMMEAGIHSFLLATHVLENQGDNLLAASFSLEAGQHLMKCGRYSQAAVFFQKAVSLQSQTLYWRLDTLRLLFTCRLKQRDYSCALSILSQIVAECDSKDGPSYQWILDECHISQLLLLIFLKPNKKNLSNQLSNVLEHFSHIPSSSSELSEERLLLHSLLISANERDYQSLKDAGMKLRPYLTTDQKLLLHIVMEEHSSHHSLH